MLHAKSRAKRGKGPSMSLGVIKNPRQALFLAQRIVDTSTCLDRPSNEYSADDQMEMKELLLVARGKKTFPQWRKEVRAKIKMSKLDSDLIDRESSSDYIDIDDRDFNSDYIDID
jgi:hypothetical protein